MLAQCGQNLVDDRPRLRVDRRSPGSRGDSSGTAANNLQPAEYQAGSPDLALGWTRRSRDGFAWIDEVDAPLSERIEQYRVAIAGLAASDEFMADAPSLTVAATTVGSLGSGPATIEVRQIGDLAASFPAQLSVILP